jgi:hypothetical protein
VKVKQIAWQEQQPANEKIPYDHIIGVTNLGNFKITWKGWKSQPSYDIEHTIFGWMSSEVSIDAAKAEAQSRFEATVLACMDY